MLTCPRSRLRIWSRETGLAVSSRVSLLSVHTQTESGPDSRDEGFNDWGGRGYDDFVPGEVTKRSPSGDETT